MIPAGPAPTTMASHVSVVQSVVAREDFEKGNARVENGKIPAMIAVVENFMMIAADSTTSVLEGS